MPEDEEWRALLRPPVSLWVAAFNAHDVAAIVSLYADDAELFDAGMRRPRRGCQEIRAWFEKRFRTMPTISYRVNGPVFMEETEAALAWTTSGRSPRLLGQPWLSRPIRVDGVSVFVLRYGLIARQRGYYDHLAVVEQIVSPLKWLAAASRL